MQSLYGKVLEKVELTLFRRKGERYLVLSYLEFMRQSASWMIYL